MKKIYLIRKETNSKIGFLDCAFYSRTKALEFIRQLTNRLKETFGDSIFISSDGNIPIEGMFDNYIVYDVCKMRMIYNQDIEGLIKEEISSIDSELSLTTQGG